MENNNFIKLFFQILFLINLIILGSTAFVADLSSKETENIKILITSSTGMQFAKENVLEGKKIIYDCSIGLKEEGEIDVFDNIHPTDMNSLIIKNCYKIKLLSDGNKDYFNFNELKISNVNSLLIVPASGYYRCKVYSNSDFKLSISNIEFLEFSSDQYCTLLQSKRFSENAEVSINIQNVLIDTLKENTFLSGKELWNLHFKNVKINRVDKRAIVLNENPNSFLTVEDSDLGFVHTDAFVFNGSTIKIINSTFHHLDERGFLINKSRSFIFLDNNVKIMQNPFYVVSTEVSIINNFFDSTLKPWLSEIIAQDIQSFGVLNITGNLINHWPYNLFFIELQNLPDVLIFENNSLICSCKNINRFAYRLSSFNTDIFLNKNQKNFCVNFGNCLLSKVVRKASDVCSGKFRCPEGDQEDADQNTQMCPSHLNSILSVLQNIDIKLDKIVSKYNSSLVHEPNQLH